jgi:hypothetical protein
MYRILRPNKDAYITNKVVRGSLATAANTGKAGSIDLFKFHGVSRLNGVYVDELSRALVCFDLSSLQSDYAAGKFSISNASFSARLQLVDVYGGQPTPANFTMTVYPLSKSFDEGLGRDVVYYSDSDIVNFLTASYNSGNPTTWNSAGANAKGLLGSPDIDIIASGNLGAGIVNLWSSQTFTLGTENLDVNVTPIVSASLANLVQFNGFRISYSDAEENNDYNYFVKRFGSSHASDPYVRPKLVIKYDDSITDNAGNFTFDNVGTLFIRNFVRGNPANLTSGSALTPVVGQNCMLLRLETKQHNSTGTYTTYITASQHAVGAVSVTGLYSASFSLNSSDSVFKALLQTTGSVTFKQIWSSFDETVAYFSGSLTVHPQMATNDTTPRKLAVNVTNVLNEYRHNEVARLKLFIFDRNLATIKLVKTPFETQPMFLDAVYYSVRDVITNDVIVPFDTTLNSTKVSNDASNLYFDLHVSSLFVGRSYVVDVLIVDAGQQVTYRGASPAFRVIA